MEKLTIKELAPYLAYGLKILSEDGTSYDTITNIQIAHIIKYDRIGEVKIILRPLSDLTKEIEVNGEKFVPIDVLNESFEINGLENTGLGYMIYGARNENAIISINEMIENSQKLFEWHFDVFGLIEKNLAIDINTLENV